MGTDGALIEWPLHRVETDITGSFSSMEPPHVFQRTALLDQALKTILPGISSLLCVVFMGLCNDHVLDGNWRP